MAERSKQTGGAAPPQTGLPGRVKVKEEIGDSSMAQHDHTFSVQFKGSGGKTDEINCREFQTVLTAIQSRDRYKQLSWSDDEIVIQRGTGDRENIIATHFPCSCIKAGDALIVSERTDTVEQKRDHRAVLPQDKYSVFFIHKEGGTNTKSKQLFINSEVKEFNSVCVYGERDITVQEALKRDGRFLDISSFKLSDYNKSKNAIQSTDTINSLNGRKFKIELPRGVYPKKPEDPGAPSGATQTGETPGVRDRTPGASGPATQTEDTRPDVVQRSGTRVSTAVEEGRVWVRIADKERRIRVSTAEEEGQTRVSTAEEERRVDLKEIKKILCQQFPVLRKLMENRFTGRSFQAALNLKKENFGKIRGSFSQVHKLEKLLERGRSVCLVVIDGVSAGTGFVLIDNFIMTNAHLFTDCNEGNKLKEGTDVYVLFNYNLPLHHTQYQYFKLEESYICYSEDELDYAILKVQREGQQGGPAGPAGQIQTQPGPAGQIQTQPGPAGQIQTQPGPAGQIQIPPGLLEFFWDMPTVGGACLIGHPGGDVKQIDPACVIKPEEREQAADSNLNQYKDSPFIVPLVNQVKGQGIDKIMLGGSRANKGMTYNTFMYHGASGSPVFDALGRVCGLHTSGYVYGFPKATESVIEFAQSLEIIMKHLVTTLMKGKDQELLGKIKEVADRNPFVRKVCESGLQEPSAQGSQV